MQGQARERWKDRCEQAAIEQDPAKFSILVQEIFDLLEMKSVRLGKNDSSPFHNSPCAANRYRYKTARPMRTGKQFTKRATYS